MTLIKAVEEFYRRPMYWNWVRSEAALIDTDGCSHVSGFNVDYCMEHDLGYYYARDACDAYFRYRGGAIDPWKDAKPMTRAAVDARFRQRHQTNSKFGQWSPMAWWRWAGVRGGGRVAWEKHRERERQAAALRH